MDGRMDFQDWRDDICLVYGKTYARVQTAEVRCSINRPLLESHVNGTRVYPHTPTRHARASVEIHTHTHTRRDVHTCAALSRAHIEPIHAKSLRELLFRLFTKGELQSFHNSLSISVIDLRLSLSLSLSCFLSLSLSFVLWTCVDVSTLLLHLTFDWFCLLLSTCCFF